MSSKRKQIHGRNPSRGDKDGSQQPVRIGGRIKKAKTIFDPSDSLYPRKRRMNILQAAGQSKKPGLTPGRKRKDSHNSSKMLISNGDDSGTLPERKPLSFYQGWCLICLKNHPKLITCKTCSYKAHFECLDKRPGMTFEDLEHNWHCPQCKMCVVCQKTADFGVLTQCMLCFDFYHNTCHRPRIITKGNQRRKWNCRNCGGEALSESSESGVEESVSSGEASPAQSNSPTQEEAKYTPEDAKTANISDGQENTSSTSIDEEKPETKAKSENLENVPNIVIPFAGEPVPDAATWSASEVYGYFSHHFPNEAEVFREQEIDGASLVLMKRDDVVSGLKLKLGPAIRIYRHVLMLQKRSSDPRLSWSCYKMYSRKRRMSYFRTCQQLKKIMLEEELSESSNSSADESLNEYFTCEETKNSCSAQEEDKEASPDDEEASKTLEAQQNATDTSIDEDHSEMNEEDEKPDVSCIVTPFADKPAPDVSTWSIFEVYNYFLNYFPNQAAVFYEQEIDGASLMFLERSDVLTKMQLKFGPAVKIWEHVIILQKTSSKPYKDSYLFKS
ncbi:uncharacterized protein LOC132259228 [Phlebotomus argentipes]|uniref:uncharacterized protein LOC132259228 n=1 Tax=Phlebotomus argentipes TaxID=94469 RepID=UPI002892AAA2|nr:uncharacterized protein LOC132259228 [Phlebotomus argentipes]